MMRPLSDMPDAVLARATWLAFDVDDTVTENGHLHSRSLDAMERLVADGVRLAAVTGRPLGWVEIFMYQWPIELGVGENGAGWFVRDGDVLQAGTFVPRDDELADARARAVAVAREAAPEIPQPRDGWARRCDVAFDVGEYFHANVASTQRLVSALDSAGFVTSRSSIHVHAATATWDKARGLTCALTESRRVRAGMAPERVIFVGDSPNDDEAFAHFPESVGVANVRDHTHTTWPAYVTPSPRSRGFAELADAILGARRRARSPDAET